MVSRIKRESLRIQASHPERHLPFLTKSGFIDSGFINSRLINCIMDRPAKNDEMQGARILRNEAYNPYAAMTKDEAQHGRSRFSTAC